MRAHQRIAPVVVALLLLLVPVLPSLAQPVPETRLYIGHRARLTADIPAGWTIDPNLHHAYRGPDGVVFSGAFPADTLSGACDEAATLFEGTAIDTTWSGEPACEMDGTFQDETFHALVVPHPTPFMLLDQRMAFAFIATDPEHFESITATLSFDPARVTPQEYLGSVIDIVEAMAWWGEGIDWEFTREYMLASVEGLETIESIHGSLLNLVSLLRGAGDNHSGVLLPDQANALQENSGFGMYLGGDRVIAVFPDGPAAHAGLQTGDVIETVNGESTPPGNGLDPALAWNASQTLWRTPAMLIVSREGLAELFTVTLEVDTYEFYLPPTGLALAGGIGYIDIPLYRIPGREAEFASTASDIIAEIDQSPTCGWIVDLRLNLGGNYAPMVSGVGPLLGEGTFSGWAWRNGTQNWLEYQDGVIFEDGQEVSNYFAPTGPYALQHPNPPVAVLTSNYTGSSGEVTALAFTARPDTRFFGERTGGYTTGNRGFFLFDGSVLSLATTAMTDRNGETYLQGIPPDEVVEIDWATHGTADDPVLIAAQEWLASQPACAGATPVASPIPGD